MINMNMNNQIIQVHRAVCKKCKQNKPIHLFSAVKFITHDGGKTFSLVIFNGIYGIDYLCKTCEAKTKTKREETTHLIP